MKFLDLFLAEKTANQTDRSANVYTNFYNRVSSYFPEEKEPKDFDRADFIRILENMNAKAVGNFTVAKSNIRDFVAWMVQHEYMTEDQLNTFSDIQYYDLDSSDTFKLYYFKNFEELRSSLEQTIECHLGDFDNDGEFDTLRCAVYLSWYRFTVEELIQIMKDDVSQVEPIVYKGKDRIPIRVGEKCIDHIREYAEKESYRSRKFGRADGVEMRYKDSKFLFRSCKSGQLVENQITAMTRYTNPYADEVGKRFAFGKIYQSGMYYRIYLDEQENGELKRDDYDRMAKLFGLTEEELNIKAKKYDLSSRKYQQYQEYKKAFYNN